MTLPFTRGEFLDVFAAYNESFAPAVFLLWAATVAVVVVVARAARPDGRLIASLLAVHWLWAGLAYQAVMFTTINPAAWIFATLFVAQAMLFVWFGIARPALGFSRDGSRRHVMAWMLIVYALLYPGLAWGDGLAYPRMPTFGVPCPTTILTAGFLLAADPPLPVALTVVPIAWTVVGGSAAFLLGVHADLILPVAGLCLMTALIHKHELRRVRL